MLSKMRPVLVFGLNADKVHFVHDELFLGGVKIGDIEQTECYSCFVIPLDRAVWPELKVILDRVNWTQVYISERKD